MFKWPNTPSARAPRHELADFAELLCWKQETVSMSELAQALGRLAENDYSEGVPEEEDIPSDVEEAFQEIEARMLSCGGGYPFEIGDAGNFLYRVPYDENHQHLVYTYLLLATRLNMNENRDHAGTNGTQLLELLSSEVARKYLGNRAKSLVFGTAEDAGDFPGKINSLCQALGEGGGFAGQVGRDRQKKDDKLDVVAWKPFSDQREGKLIAFGQCKTGTSWKDTVSQLQPDNFCKKWFLTQPTHIPVRMFFVSEALSSVEWRNECMDAGLLFDRCRIVDFTEDINADLTANLRNWTRAAGEATDLPNPFA